MARLRNDGSLDFGDEYFQDDAWMPQDEETSPYQPPGDRKLASEGNYGYGDFDPSKAPTVTYTDKAAYDDAGNYYAGGLPGKDAPQELPAGEPNDIQPGDIQTGTEVLGGGGGAGGGGVATTSGVPPSPYSSPGAGAPGAGQAGNLTGMLQSMFQQMMSGQQAKQDGLDAHRKGLKSKLDEMIGLYSRPVTGNDPGIKEQTFNYEGKMGRALQRQREKMASRAHAEGLPTGAFDSWVGGSELKAGQATADYEGRLIADEMKQRRAALSDMLAQSRGLLSEEDQMDLNRQIAMIDANLRGQGSDRDYDLGLKGLDMQKYGIDANSAVGMAGVGASNHATDMRTQLGYDQLTYDMGRDQNTIDQILTSMLLSGGGL